jgi:hypothetical protein
MSIPPGGTVDAGRAAVSLFGTACAVHPLRMATPNSPTAAEAGAVVFAFDFEFTFTLRALS